MQWLPYDLDAVQAWLFKYARCSVGWIVGVDSGSQDCVCWQLYFHQGETHAENFTFPVACSKKETSLLPHLY